MGRRRTESVYGHYDWSVHPESIQYKRFAARCKDLERNQKQADALIARGKKHNALRKIRLAKAAAEAAEAAAAEATSTTVDVEKIQKMHE